MSDEIAPADYYEECPKCGSDDLETWVEKVEYGSPVNSGQKPVAEAPRYKMKPARFFICKECNWGKP